MKECRIKSFSDYEVRSHEKCVEKEMQNFLFILFYGNGANTMCKEKLQLRSLASLSLN